MRFLANENFPAPSIQLLRDPGWAVDSIREENQGAKDLQVTDRAKKESLIILTLDKDYGEIIFKTGLTDPPDVLFLRYRGRDPLAPGRLVLALLSTTAQLDGRFTVLEEDGIRQRIYR